MKTFDPIDELAGRNVQVRYGDVYKKEPLIVPIIPDHLKRGPIHRAWEICIQHAYVIALQLAVPKNAKPLSVRKLLSMGLLTIQGRKYYLTQEGAERVQRKCNIVLRGDQVRNTEKTLRPVRS